MRVSLEGRDQLRRRYQRRDAWEVMVEERRQLGHVCFQPCVFAAWEEQCAGERAVLVNVSRDTIITRVMLELEV